MANCYVVIKGFDRDKNRVITNELYHSLEDVKPFVSGVKKKECGFTPKYRAFSNVEKAQLFLDSIAGNGQTEKMKQKTKPEVTAKKKDNITNNKNIIQKNNESKKMKDILIPSILQTPLVKQISEEFIHIYVDGSYDRYNKIGGGGIVFVKNNQILIRDFFQCTSDITKSLSSVGMERLTVKRAIELAIANSYSKVIIHYDFNGIVDCLNGENETGDIHTKNYKKMIDVYSNWIEIQFQKEKAHRGNVFHDLADQLAKFAIRVM